MQDKKTPEENTKKKDTKKKSIVEKNTSEKNTTKEKSKVEEKPIEENSTEENKAEERTQDKYQQNEEPRERLTKSKRFYNVMDKFGDLFYLNILFILTSLPIITIGASFTALYTITNKMVDDDEPPVKDAYFKAFKENFKQSTTLWIIDLIIFYLMYLQYQYVILYNNEGAKLLFVVLGFEFIFMAFAVPLQFPLVARYINTTGNMFKNALILSLANLWVWFRMFFLWTFPIMIYYVNPKIMFYIWFLWLLIMTSVTAYACSLFLKKFYAKLERPKE